MQPLKAETINLKHRQPITSSSLCAWKSVWVYVCVCVVLCMRVQGQMWYAWVCDRKRWSWSYNLVTHPPMCVNAVSPVFQSCSHSWRLNIHTEIHTSSLLLWTYLRERCCVHLHVLFQIIGIQLFPNLKHCMSWLLWMWCVVRVASSTLFHWK